MSSETTLWLVIASLLVTCLAAIGAKSLRQFSRHELQEICRRRKSERRFHEIIANYERVALGVETLQVVATAVAVVSSCYWILLREGAAGELRTPDLRTLLVSVGIGGVLLLAVEIWLPWAAAHLWSEQFIYWTWRPLRAASLAITPLVWAARFTDEFFHRLAGRPKRQPSEQFYEEEIRTIVTEGHREGLLQEEARGMIEGVIELRDIDVAEIMTPRTDMVFLSLRSNVLEAARRIIEEGHTRIPVYDKNRDDVVGVLYAKDLLPELLKLDPAKMRPLPQLLRKPFFVPETKRVAELLREFQQTRHHMAVVLDEYGGVSGLVTIEDVLEEIVGEIVDEYDEELVEEIRVVDENVAEVSARAHIDEINERLGLQLTEDGDFDTIGGYVFSELGHIPVAGESLQRDGVRITVLEATPRRIERLLIERLEQPQRESA